MENLNPYSVEPMKIQHFEGVSKLGDLVFGDNYIADIGLKEDWSLITAGGISLVVLRGDQICAARISYPPGQWQHLSAFAKANPKTWGLKPEDVAYFKLSMVHPSHRGQGLAKKMARKAIEGLTQLGAKGIVTHSWNESPAGGSRSFIDSLGFKAVGQVPGFWKEYVYECNVCLQVPCACTATEMVLLL